MKAIIVKRSYIEDMIAVLLILLSSGTFCFYHQHSILSCFSLFFYGAYLFVRRKTRLSSVIKNKSFLFVVIYTFWIWINFLVINTNHVEAVTQPYVGSSSNLVVISFLFRRFSSSSFLIL